MTSDCSQQQIDTDHYLMMAKVTVRMAVRKQRADRFCMEKSNLKKLNGVEGKEQYHVEISSRFTALKSLDNKVEITIFFGR
jgi:hypothetical protein